MNTKFDLLYEKGFSIIINDIPESIESSICYYFDYDERYHSYNMEFPHFHIFYEIMIPLCPKAYHYIEGKKYTLLTGDIILLPPSVLHQSEYLKGDPSDRIVIGFMLPQNNAHFAGGYKFILDALFDKNKPVYRFHNEERISLFNILNEIVMINKNMDKAVIPLLTHGKFCEFLYKLYSLKDRNNYELNCDDGIDGKIYSIANYIHTHYKDDISLELIAREYFISTYYLSHRFKKVMGYPLTGYIHETRIKNAQYLLINSQKKISEIAFETGFLSFSQFNRIFKRICGISPTEYRKRNGSSQNKIIRYDV